MAYNFQTMPNPFLSMPSPRLPKPETNLIRLGSSEVVAEIGKTVVEVKHCIPGRPARFQLFRGLIVEHRRTAAQAAGAPPVHLWPIEMQQWSWIGDGKFCPEWKRADNSVRLVPESMIVGVVFMAGPMY